MTMADPMEIDPIDDGPVVKGGQEAPPPPPPPPLYSLQQQQHLQQLQGHRQQQPLSKEEEARLCIEQLRGEDVAARVTAANRLEMVASALGPKRTRDELLPFLTDGVDDEDEVLVAIAESLGKLVEQVGGVEHAQSLLPPLELLLTVEESTVRDAASKSAQQVASVLSQDAFLSDYATMVTRLGEMEWFTARISAAGLISATFARLADSPSSDTKKLQESQVKLFAALCRDETPMVRKVAGQHLGEMLEVVADTMHKQDPSKRPLETEDSILVTTLIPLYEELASNEQPDSVRLQTTQNCVYFGKVLSKSLEASGSGSGPPTSLSETELAQVERILPLIVATIDDRSWRVRWTAASKFAAVIAGYDCNLLPPSIMDALVPAYEKLLQDPEAEVRTAATFNLAAVAKCSATVPEPGPGSSSRAQATTSTTRITVAERLVKRVTSLTEDDSEHVRAALALVATELAPILGKAGTISSLVPPVLLLLRDAASEVRLNLISSLSSLNEVIGVDLLSQSLLPAILDLAQDGKWRIRLSIIHHIPQLAKQLGMDFFSERLSSLCVGWLADDIASIREAAAVNLQSLTALFGSDWALEYILPAIEEIRHDSYYLRRLTAIQACSLMATEVEPDVAVTDLLPLVLDMAMDEVPNIRFNVAKGLEKMGAVCGTRVMETQIRPVLSMLADDVDRDVRFYAEKSIKCLNEAYSSVK